MKMIKLQVTEKLMAIAKVVPADRSGEAMQGNECVIKILPRYESNLLKSKGNLWRKKKKWHYLN